MRLSLVARHERDDQDIEIASGEESAIGALLFRMKQEIANDPAREWTLSIQPAFYQDTNP